MSPEQAVGTKGVGPATDIFSLGALLYYAATGEPAFGTGPATAMLYRTVHAAVDMTPITSAPLRDLIDACLEKNPDDRPNAKHVAIAARTGQPVVRLPRTSTPPTGVPTGATALTTGGLSATYAGGPSAYDALMDQVAIATASRGNPIIQPQSLSTGKVPLARRRSPSVVQAAAGAALLVALIAGGVVMLSQKDAPEAPTANVSGSKDEPSPSATGAAAVADKSGIKAGGVGTPTSVPTPGRRITLSNGTVIVPTDGTTATMTPSRTTGPKPSTTKAPTGGGATTKPGTTTSKPSTTGGGGGTTDPGDTTTAPGDPTTDPGDPTTDPGDPTTDPGIPTTDPTTTTDSGVIP
jgi:serine/threonine protein kinase